MARVSSKPLTFAAEHFSAVDLGGNIQLVWLKSQIIKCKLKPVSNVPGRNQLACTGSKIKFLAQSNHCYNISHVRKSSKLGIPSLVSSVRLISCIAGRHKENILSIRDQITPKKEKIPKHTRTYCRDIDCEDMDLKKVVRQLESLAPTSLAASWDNVGLLVEPSPPHTVSQIMLTNDLTSAVMAEALQKKVDMILSYHPPIFTPLKRLRQGLWKERLVVQCVENRIALYSPHTAYDCFQGGTGDWLVSPFEGKVAVLEPSTGGLPTLGAYNVQVTIQEDLLLGTLAKLKGIQGASIIEQRECVNDNNKSIVCLNCTEKASTKVCELLAAWPEIYQTLQITKLHKPFVPNVGGGRMVSLTTPVSLADAVSMVKRHLGLDHLRLATATGVNPDSLISSVAAVPGSGGSLLRGVKADLYLTGEMSHHEVLDATHRGSTVILADHSNTERGFLTPLKDKLTSMLEDKVQVFVSQKDADPLKVV